MTDGSEESDETGEEPAGEGAEAAEESAQGEEEAAADAGAEETALDPETLDARLDEAAEELEAAETEADLDVVESDLEEVEADLEAADLPEPDDEDEEDPAEALESELATLREELEAARGPYAEDVAATVEDARSDVEGAEWTEAGVEELGAAVESFVATVEAELEVSIDVAVDEPSFEDEPYVAGSELEGITGTLEEAAAAVTDAGLDPDADAETVETLLAAAETLREDVEAATAWSDLTVRDQLRAHGYYDVLAHRKDFPPEWGALKVWEKRGRADMVLLAFEKLDSDFMEEHCLDALARMGTEEAVEPMLDMADKRNRDAIRILGNVGTDEAVDTLLEYTDQESDPLLQKATLTALGKIGSEEATGAVADQLAAEDDEVRSHAARALGLLGDTRAIDPLADVLEDDDTDAVRASAAWALNQIGTERALEVLLDYADDRAYVVQAEAEKAT